MMRKGSDTARYRQSSVKDNLKLYRLQVIQCNLFGKFGAATDALLPATHLARVC